MSDLERRVMALEGKLEELVDLVTHCLATVVLPWRVDVLCSGGWKTLARFDHETDAWAWAHRWIDARVYYGDHLQGGMRGGAQCGPDKARED